MGYFSQFKSRGIPFMEGREKGKLSNMHDVDLHIVDFGFIKGTDSEYAVMLFAEDEKNFYFGNKVVTQMLKKVDEDGMRDELAKLPIVFTWKSTLDGKREYTDFIIKE